MFVCCRPHVSLSGTPWASLPAPVPMGPSLHCRFAHLCSMPIPMGEYGFDRAARSPTQVERDGEHARAAVVDAEGKHAAFAGAHSQHRGPPPPLEKECASLLSLSLSHAGTSQSDETCLLPRDFRDHCAKMTSELPPLMGHREW